MFNRKSLLLIPVENQVLEMDPKLLLACIAARNGFTSIIGSAAAGLTGLTVVYMSERMAGESGRLII